MAHDCDGFTQGLANATPGNLTREENTDTELLDQLCFAASEASDTEQTHRLGRQASARSWVFERMAVCINSDLRDKSHPGSGLRLTCRLIAANRFQQK
jgi:hypothetical protein